MNPFFIRSYTESCGVDDGSEEMDLAGILDQLHIRKRVELFRLPKHTTIGNAWNACIGFSRGSWIQILHSDDVVLPQFYSRVLNAVSSQSQFGLFCCNTSWIGADGARLCGNMPEQHSAGVMERKTVNRLFVRNTLTCSGVLVQRAVYERLGGFREELVYSLDWAVWQRIAMHYPIWYDPEPLFLCRRHSYSATAALAHNPRKLRDIRRTIEIVRQYLPGNVKGISEKAAAELACEAIWQSKRSDGPTLCWPL